MQSDISSMYIPYDLVCENKWYKDHSLLIFNDEYLFVFNIYYHYGDTHLSCIGNDIFGCI